jgi:hypothetical protein
MTKVWDDILTQVPEMKSFGLIKMTFRDWTVAVPPLVAHHP